MQEKLAILGSTGSIGMQTLDICRHFPDRFAVEVLTAGKNAPELIKQALEFNPAMVVIDDESKYDTVVQGLKDTDINIYCGSKSIADAAIMGSVDTVVLSLVGIAGLKPAYEALKTGKKLALANKEVLVVAGELITKTAMAHHAPIIPIDSEHSAIMQCLQGESPTNIEKVILTASGGPFRGYTKEQLKDATRDKALAHPVWNMGNKITIDSATLMNKGFEVIEACWLFSLPVGKMDIVIHPQSIIHSMVQFVDGSVKAQLSRPDMRLPILYALTWPDRVAAPFQTGGINNIQSLSFEKPDLSVFRHLALAFRAMEMGGGAPCILNAANEVAVQLFLDEKLSFAGMQEMTDKALSSITDTRPVSVEDFVRLDQETRSFCLSLNSNYHGNSH